MAEFFDDIIKSLDGAEPQPKRKRGRPKSEARIKAEAEQARAEFIDDYESITENRPEPQRLIIALSLPVEEQRQALEDAMNPRQLAFCREYVIDFNQKNAAIRAGYAESNAANTAYYLMQYRGIRRLIELYTASNAQRVTAIDKDYIITKVIDIVATANKDSDKLRGLELLARHLGMFVDRTEITGKDGEAIKYEETRREADEVANMLRTMAKKTELKVVGGSDS